MNEDERRALSKIRFGWAPNKEEVWSPPEGHIAGLNGAVTHTLLGAFEEASGDSVLSPLGVVIEGQPGSGKTHLLAWLREEVQRQGGYFFLLGTPRGRRSYEMAVLAFIEGLTRPAAKHSDQLTMLLSALCDQAMLPKTHKDQILGKTQLTRDGLEDFIARLRFANRREGRRCQNTLRALVMMAAWDDHVQDLGEGYLTSKLDVAEADEWQKWNLPTRPAAAQDVAEEISTLLSMTGPVVIGVDQIDLAFAQARRSVIAHTMTDHGDEPLEVVQLAEDIGQALMDMRESLLRTVIAVTCLNTSWELICNRTFGSIKDRFREEERLFRIPSRTVGMELVAARFAPRFASASFTPPFPTWPIAPAAFDNAPDYTPRALLQRVDAHVRECLRSGSVTILTDFEQKINTSANVPPTGDVATERELAAFDRQLETLRIHADVQRAVDEKQEDNFMPDLLVAGLHAWVREKSEEERRRYTVLAGAGGSTTVHATLRETFDSDTDDVGLWYFRGLARIHFAAVLPRVRRIMDFAALDPTVPHRRAILLRNSPWPNGKVCSQVRQEFEGTGGVITKITQDDLRTFHALGKMLEEDEPFLDAWLAKRRPASGTALFTEIFGSPPESPMVLPEPDNEPSGPSRIGSGFDEDPVFDIVQWASETSEKESGAEDSVAIGVGVDNGLPALIGLQALRKHVAIFAGSGSGKTVLIRRLIEECALHGVSTIALDPNNDLARLGDPWPVAPPSWRSGDGERAAQYFEQTDVVVWTPRREAGRPLSLQPLPDFKAVLDDPDEFELALDSAVAALAPRARMGGNTSKMDRGRAVLREALSHYARKGGSHLTGFVDLLADLPDGVTPLDKARDLAHDMAQTLTAAMINDPLFGGSGVPLDPGVLLTPAPGKRARISVISLIGLPSPEQRQSFVNQLQMALFAWIKLHPANDRPLGGLFVMDEAQTLAPSGAMTPCTESTLALASQARKYGLGLVFATQAPRGIHNRIVGNAATQFYGFLNSPVQITAAKEMAQAKGSAVMDIARLIAGEFYAMGEGIPFRKLATPMCLSHHPPGALTPEEIVERARASSRS
jgi:hypothetical protein